MPEQGSGVQPRRRYEPDDFAPTRPFTAVLDLLREAKASGQFDTALDMFLIAWRPAFRRIASNLVHARQLDPNTWTNDALSTTISYIAAQLPKLVDSGKPVQNLPAYLRKGLTRDFDAFLDSSSGLDSRTELPTIKRKQMRLATLRSQFVHSFGREPSDPELIKWANDQQQQSAPNAKAGRFKIEDLRPVQGILSTDVENGEQLAVTDDAASGLLAPVDRKRLATIVITQAQASGPDVHRCARAMFDRQFDEPPEPFPNIRSDADVTAVAHMLQMRKPRARALMSEVLDLARTVLAVDFQIRE